MEQVINYLCTVSMALARFAKLCSQMLMQLRALHNARSPLYPSHKVIG